MQVKFADDLVFFSDGETAFGDPDLLPELNKYIGGNDTLYGSSFAAGYTAIGDTNVLFGGNKGGNDVFYSGDHVGSGTTSLNFFSDDGAHFIGDAMLMTDNSVGGRDYMQAGFNSNVSFLGDASQLEGSARGANDTLLGSSSFNTFSDNSTAFEVSQNGASTNWLMGDAYSMGYSNVITVLSAKSGVTNAGARGGQDSIVGGDASASDGSASVVNLVAGDAYAMQGLVRGGDDKIQGGFAMAHDGYSVAMNLLMGDGYFMGNGAIAGRDDMYGGDAVATGSDGTMAIAINLLVGDSFLQSDGAVAGNDRLFGGDARGDSHHGGNDAYALNLLVGDTLVSFDSTFGKDQLTGGDGSGDGYVLNVLIGDTANIDMLLNGGLPGLPPIVLPLNGGDLSKVFGGDIGDLSKILGGEMSTLSRGASVESKSLIEDVHYANDVLNGGSGQTINLLVGDAMIMVSDSTGGNDTLISGDGMSNLLIGDGYAAYGEAHGGKDKLVSGHGDDTMVGDALYETTFSDGSGDGMIGGADKFVFMVKNGHDVIVDFHVSEKDKIDLSDFRGESADFHSWADFVSAGRAEQVSDGVLLHLDIDSASTEKNTVLIMGVDLEDLGRSSFTF